jgi:hypothetical protein
VEPETGVVKACDLAAGNVGDAQAAPSFLEWEPAETEVLGDQPAAGREYNRLRTAT